MKQGAADNPFLRFIGYEMTSKNLAPPNFGIKSGSSTKLNASVLADWSEMKQEIGSDHGDSDSEVSESETFLGKLKKKIFFTQGLPKCEA